MDSTTPISRQCPGEGRGRQSAIRITALDDQHQVIGERVLDLAREWPPLVKGLAWRMAAHHPESAGVPYALRLAKADRHEVVLEVTADSRQGSVTRRFALSPMVFSPLAASLGTAAGLPARSFSIAIATEAACSGRGSVGLVLEQSERCLPSRDLFHPQPGSIEPVCDRWLHCRISEKASQAFATRARQAVTEEHFVALGRVMTGFGQGRLVLSIQSLLPLPGRAESSAIHTTGEEFMAALATLPFAGLQVVGYTHLHPPGMGVDPSPADALTFWNLSASLPCPLAFLITEYGRDADAADPHLAALAYLDGRLQHIDWEICT